MQVKLPSLYFSQPASQVISISSSGWEMDGVVCSGATVTPAVSAVAIVAASWAARTKPQRMKIARVMAAALVLNK